MRIDEEYPPVLQAHEIAFAVAGIILPARKLQHPLRQLDRSAAGDKREHNGESKRRKSGRHDLFLSVCKVKHVQIIPKSGISDAR